MQLVGSIMILDYFQSSTSSSRGIEFLNNDPTLTFNGIQIVLMG